jgi:hypothetical protein
VSGAEHDEKEHQKEHPTLGRSGTPQNRSQFLLPYL